MNSRTVSGILVGLLLLAAGCSGSPDELESEGIADHPAAAPDVFESSHGNYDLTWSLEELFEQQAVAVVGRVEAVTDGPELLWRNEKGEPDYRDNTAVVAVRVERRYKSTLSPSDAEIVYISVDRGTSALDVDGNPLEGAGEGWTVQPVEEIAAHIPIDTPVLVVSGPRTLGAPSDGIEVVAPGRGHPHGSELLDGRHPMMFSLHEGGDVMSGWGRSLEDLEEELRAARSTGARD